MSVAPGSIDLVVAALYRRYRPESFAEMIGQSQVTDPLMTALRSGRIGHAYLFSGPRGCGKTTSARILARCLNCAEGPTDTPCGECPSCVELSRDGGGSLDVVEIDAASHGGVEDARDLRERAVFAPARDRFKIFIIDEAHMVTPGGFNALLKIVEEPPPHVKFVFATTEPDKVIGTIRSRTHHYPFRLIAPGTLIDYVQSLCESEGVQVEPGVLPLVVRAGGGSVRDTLSILDQLIAGSETSLVTSDRAAGLLGFTHTELLDDVVSAFGMDDPSAAFHATDRVVQTGQDPRRFVEDLLERLRDLIVVGATTVDGAAAVFRGVPQDQLTRMFEQAQRFAPGQLSRIADVVSAALDKMAGATAPRLQLELMVARVLVQAGASAQNASPVHNGATRGQQAQGTQAQSHAAQTQAQTQTPVKAPQSSTQPQPQAQAGRQQGAGNAPIADKPNPLSAVAAARSAATQAPAASLAEAPQSQAAVQDRVLGQAGTPDAAVTPTAADAPAPASPNAAQTAASIREFLRDESAGASESAPAAPAPSGADKPHPNAGAAGFGRPISDVLSAAQIESIGSEPIRPAATGAAPVEPAKPAPTTPSAVSAATGPTRSTGPQGGELGKNSSADAEDSVATPEPSSIGEDSLPSDDTETGFEDLLELWPDLLEEILESDRDAWNAVHPVVPLGLDGDVLTIGLATESDLATFKTGGAGPLRETILTAVGISVKYKPTRMPASSAPAAQGAAREPRPDADAEEPHQADPNDPIARATARLNGLGPALAAPAWADPPIESPAKPPAEAPVTSQSAVPAPPFEPEKTGHSAANVDVVPSTPAQLAGAPAEPEAPQSGGVAPVDAAPVEVATVEAAAADAGSTDAGAPEEEAVAAAQVFPAGSQPPSSEPTSEPSPELSTEPSPETDPFAAGDPYSAADEMPSEAFDDDPYGDGYREESARFVPGSLQGKVSRDQESQRADVTDVSDRAAAAIAATAATAAASGSRSAGGGAVNVSDASVGSDSNGPAPTGATTETPAVDGTPEHRADADSATNRSAPAFTRYGEAVVREVLGARFVEERPLPPR